MTVRVEQVTAALVKVTSAKAIGPFGLVMWMGSPDAIGFNDNDFDEELLSIFTASRYRYASSPWVYEKGRALTIRGECENKSCFCTGACMIEAPAEKAKDEYYFKQKG